MNIIHTTESDTKDIPEGQLVRAKCGKTLTFRSHGTKPPGGKICILCDNLSMSKAGTPPYILAVFEEEKLLMQTASA